jgi:c-di-GMP-related signal transduction protein
MKKERYKKQFKESSYYSQGYFFPGPFFTKSNNGVEIKFLLEALKKLKNHLEEMESVGWSRIKLNDVGEFEGTK